eukprot:518080_1
MMEFGFSMVFSMQKNWHFLDHQNTCHMTSYSSMWTNRSKTVWYLSSRLFNNIVNMSWTIQTYFAMLVIWGNYLHVFHHQKWMQSYKTNVYHKKVYLKIIKFNFTININSCSKKKK